MSAGPCPVSRTVCDGCGTTLYGSARYFHDCAAHAGEPSVCRCAACESRDEPWHDIMRGTDALERIERRER